MGKPAPVVSTCTVGLEANCLREISDGPNMVSLHEAHMTPTQIERHIARREANGLAVIGARTHKISQTEFGPSAPGEIRAISWMQCDGLVKIRHRLLIGAGVDAGAAPVAVSQGHVLRRPGSAGDDFGAGTQPQIRVARLAT